MAVLESTRGLRPSSSKEVKVSCDFNCSSKCKKTWRARLKIVNSVKKNNKGKIICKFCSNKLKGLKYKGRNNPACLHKDIEDNLFKNIDTEFKAYFLGLICSDGHIAENRISIEIRHSDKDILEKIVKKLDKTLKLYVRTRIQETGYKSKLVSLKINSKEWSEDLCKLLKIKPGKKCFTIRFPKLKNKNLQWHFIRGVFDGDGSIRRLNLSTKRSLSCDISSGSYKFIKELHRFINIPSRIGNKGLELDAINAMRFLDKLYENSTIRLNRKYKLYKQWKKLRKYK